MLGVPGYWECIAGWFDLSGKGRRAGDAPGSVTASDSTVSLYRRVAGVTGSVAAGGSTFRAREGGRPGPRSVIARGVGVWRNAEAEEHSCLRPESEGRAADSRGHEDVAAH